MAWVKSAWLLLFVLPQLTAEPLPDPLTLDDALKLSRAHPVLQLATAEVQSAQAKLDNLLAQDDLQLSLVGSLRHIEPAEESAFQQHNDSYIGLRLSKTLYDFGYSEAGEAAARKKLEGRRWLEQEVRQNRQLKITEAFFSVILADLEYARDNEAMAIAYVRQDKAQDRHELGKLSDIGLLEKQSMYQKVLQRRATSAARQRLTRTQLANAMNRPTELADNLIDPAFPDPVFPAPDLETLLAEVQQNNPRIKWLRAALESANQSVRQADSRYAPTLRGEVGATEYYRETRSTTPFEAALVLEVPLYTGGLADSEVAVALAKVEETRSLLQQSELKMRQQAVEYWLELETLKVKLKELEVLDDYRELYLDRSRSLYDLEVTSDLGDAMVQTSDVILQKTRARFQWMLAVAKLNALRGTLLPSEGEQK